MTEYIYIDMEYLYTPVFSKCKLNIYSNKIYVISSSISTHKKNIRCMIIMTYKYDNRKEVLH